MSGYGAADQVTRKNQAVVFAQQQSPEWYAVHTRSNFERRVSLELASKGIEVYLPTIAEDHQWKDRNKRVEVPIFSGYVFTRFADSAMTRLNVLQTVGVVRILGWDGAIVAIPDSEISSVRRLVASDRVLIRQPFLREGARVRVRRGPLRGVEGLLVRVKNQDRLVVSIELFSQSVATEIDVVDLDMIRPATISKRVASSQ